MVAPEWLSSPGTGIGVSALECKKRVGSAAAGKSPDSSAPTARVDEGSAPAVGVHGRCADDSMVRPVVRPPTCPRPKPPTGTHAGPHAGRSVRALIPPESGSGKSSEARSPNGQTPEPAATTGFELAGQPVLNSLDEASAAKFANAGAVAMSKCQGLLEFSNGLLERCSTFFDPVMLAQLDAALAHEFAQRDRTRVDDATEAVEAALREGRNAASLAHLSQCAATAKSVATKSMSQAALATEVLRALGGEISAAGFDPESVGQISGAVLHDVIGSLEQNKNALAAAQAYAQALFVAQQRLSQAHLGTPKEKVGRGIAHQIALARHESPFRGRQLCELSEVLVREMPYCMRAFSQGQISEYKAGIVARETAFLSLEHRQRVDSSICGDLDGVGLLGNRELAAAARKAAYALDPKAFVKRQEKAVGERYVSLRPAADGMTFLSALIPLKQGVRILATLTKIADGLKAAGDERGKGQVMADALMHRLIHHAQCNDGAGTPSDHLGVPEGGLPFTDGQQGQESKLQEGQLREDRQLGGIPYSGSRSGLAEDQQCTTVDQASISLELVMTDRTLFGSDNEPAILVGYDPIPAPIARDMVLGRGFSPRVWLKRLFTHPRTNQLLAMDSHGRLFPEGMKEFLRLQDQRCQTPYCDAPIREYDHIKAYAAGGVTSLDNGQGLCSDCNRAKESPGWFSERIECSESTERSERAGGSQDSDGVEHTGDSDPPEVAEGGPPRICVNTPTGHRYISTAPPLPGY